jgi:RNA polymerase sigma-70 factor, ECF subfamily
MTNPAQNVNAAAAVDSAQVALSADLDLVARVQSGDVAAFGELIEKHQRTVYGIVARMVGSRDDVEDIVQDVFVAAYRSIGGFRADARFTTWLHAITVNMTLKRLRDMKQGNTVSIDDPLTGLANALRSDGDPSPESVLADRERSALVRRAIDSLPEKQKMVIVLHFFEEHSCEEIAEILKCSVGTVWSRLHYACTTLRGELCRLERG